MANHFGSFIRNVQRAPRTFSYTPRFRKEENEDLERRKARIEREVAREKGEELPDSGPTGISFEGSRRHAALSRARAESNRRLTGILLLMMLLFGLLWGLDYATSLLDNEGIPFFEKMLK
jgi:hypothetical protein